MNEKVTWITVNGRHVPIKDGQSKADAIKEAFYQDQTPKFKTYKEYEESIGLVYRPRGTLTEKHFNKIREITKNEKITDYLGSSDVYKKDENGVKTFKTKQEYLDTFNEMKEAELKDLIEEENSHDENIREEEQYKNFRKDESKESGLSLKTVERIHQASMYNDSHRLEDFVLNKESEYANGGYRSDKSMSNRARQAYANNIFDTKEFSKRTGITKNKIEKYLTPSEWHHIGKSMKPVNFYDANEILDRMERLTELTEEEKEEMKKLYQ